ncbi:MAG: hypothetical protein FWC79_03855 [Oscillospiraceae bacterium]|nr:hypothetical protein [Oscillospiraceae bacterium]
MKTRKVIVSVVILAVITLMASNVFAFNNIDELMNETTPGGNEITQENTTNETANEIGNTTGNTVGAQNTTGNVDKEGLPQTGLDNSLVIIIIVCGLSALYAYKKIRDYNYL